MTLTDAVTGTKMIITEDVMITIILIILLNELSSFYELMLYKENQQLTVSFFTICDIAFLLRLLIDKKLRRRRLKK